MDRRRRCPADFEMAEGAGVGGAARNSGDQPGAASVFQPGDIDTKQSSNLDRIRMAEAGVEIIKDYPLLGVGPANVKEVYPLYRKHDAPRFRIPHLHNNVIQLWAERGVLALVAYLFLQFLFLRECARGWGGPSARFAEAGVAVAVAMAAAGMFEFNFGDTEVFWILLDLFAIVIAFIERPLPNERRSDAVLAETGP